MNKVKFTKAELKTIQGLMDEINGQRSILRDISMRRTQIEDGIQDMIKSKSVKQTAFVFDKDGKIESIVEIN